MTRINSSIHLIFLALVVSVFLAKVAGAQTAPAAAAAHATVACSVR